MRFVKSVAARYAFHIVRQFCLGWQTTPVTQASKVSAGT
jgi:adenosylhomocysteine nucleosidase